MRYFISVIMGLITGSFANVCILRLPQEESLSFPSSHCLHCGHALRFFHNVPLLSFLALKGRCAYCQAPISWQYPLIEALMAAFFLFHAFFFRTSLDHILFADILIFYLVTITIIDYRHRIIPDELSLSLLVIGLLLSFRNPYLSANQPGLKLVQSAGACLSGGLLMLGLAYAGEKAFKKEALGGGDIKLIAASGAILGWPGIFGPLLLGSLSGGLLAMMLLILRMKKLGETLPFGPFLSFGMYIACLFPNWQMLFFPFK